MLFNPLKFWLTKGPFNKLFVNYIFNKHIKWYQKVRMSTDHAVCGRPQPHKTCTSHDGTHPVGHCLVQIVACNIMFMLMTHQGMALP